MTREDAIRWLEDIHRRFNPTRENLENEGGDVHLQALDMAIEALSAEPEKIFCSPDAEWIPVSERLPEDIKPVIITWKNTDPASYYQYIVGKHFIGTGHYCNGKWYWYSSVCEDLLAEYGKSDADEVDEAIEVVAWMPLPEPYKGGESDD